MLEGSSLFKGARQRCGMVLAGMTGPAEWLPRAGAESTAAPLPLLVGPRTYLRPGRPSDWPAWAALRAESRDFLTPWEPRWPADALGYRAFRRRLRRLRGEAHRDLGQAFFIFRRDDRALLGGITLSNVRRGIARSCAVGYWIGQPFAAQGYMREALDIACRYVFQDLHLHRMEAACLPENQRSQALLLSAGFAREGLLRDYLCIDGRWRDHLLFALLEGDWRGHQRARGGSGRGPGNGNPAAR